MQLKIDNMRSKNYYRQPQIKSNYQTSFGCFKPNRKMFDIRAEYVERIAEKLGVDTKIIDSTIEGKTKKQLLFLKSLAERYNRKYFYMENKEDPQNVLDLFENIKKPNRNHFGIINMVHGSFEHLNKIFSLSKDNETLKFVMNFDKNIFRHESSSGNIITDILSSPYRSEYLNNIQKYKSYLKLNRKNDNAVKELDELIRTGKYDRSKYDIKLSTDRLFESDSKISEVFSKKDLIEHFSKAGSEFLGEFFHKYYIRRKFPFSDAGKTQLREMYITTTEENVGLRSSILDEFRFVLEQDEKETSKELEAMYSLFKKIDENKDIKEFVKHLIDEVFDVETIQEFNHIVDIIPPKKANIFNKNVIRIISKTQPGEERDLALQNEITNPFYDTKASVEKHKRSRDYVLSGFYQKESKFSKLFKYMENKFNEFRYKRAIKKAPDVQISRPEIIPATETVVKPAVYNPAESAVNIVPIQPINNSTLLLTEPERPTLLPLVKTPQSSRQAKKLLVINDVKDIISKKLHAKTYEKQEGEFAKNATKIRLRLLPEIFASIKDTRAADRAVGKLKSNSSNKDALKLYNRINGHNRKLVRYMLMKRNVDGSRMFEVKDIVAFLDKANARVVKAKSENPAIKSDYVKAYYEHLYQAKVEQYGKLTAKRSK